MVREAMANREATIVVATEIYLHGETQTDTGCLRPHKSRRSGFTLIEVALAFAILSIVLVVSYQILTNILQTERLVSRQSTPEKVGQGILALIQHDLLSVTYRNLGERVFIVYENGQPPDAQDEIHFITTRDPIMPDTLGGQLEPGGSEAYNEKFHSLLAISYRLQETSSGASDRFFTLFRSENVDFDLLDPFHSRTGGNLSYEIYDKIKSFSVECFDGREWFADWDSQIRLEEEQLDEFELLEEEERFGRVSAAIPEDDVKARKRRLESEEDEFMPFTPQLLPPSAVPVAIRISITILAGDEKGVYTDEEGFGELKEYTYSTIVPIITAMRIPLSSNEELSELSQRMKEDYLENDDSELNPLGGSGVRNERFQDN